MSKSSVPVKFSDADIPHFPESHGDFSIDYRNHNGRVKLGSGDWSFETAWSTAGAGSIHVLNDPVGIAGVAVAPAVGRIEDVTEHVFARANFTARHRTPRNGQVVLFQNTSGFVAAVQIIAVTLSIEGQPGTALTGRYCIKTDLTRSFSDEGTDRHGPLLDAAADALASLDNVAPAEVVEESLPGIGHNNPPLEQALTVADYEKLRATLSDVMSAATNRVEPSQIANRSYLFLLNALETITSWMQQRLRLVEEGFFRAIGAAAATAVIGLGLWTIVAGKLGAVVALISSLASVPLP